MKQLAAVAVLIALVLCVPLQAQTPEIDALCERAEQGDAEAHYNLGFSYANGRGVEQDFAEAVRWYRLAAEQGDADAQTLLGDMYREGRGVAQDFAEATRWYRLAAEQGDAAAQVNVGIAYLEGRGVPQDYVQGYMWFNLAASRLTGEARERAVKLRDGTADLLSPGQIAEAQRLSGEWTAGNFPANTDPPGRGRDPGPTGPLVQGSGTAVIVLQSSGHPALGPEVERELLALGSVTVVTEASQADLVLRVDATGRGEAVASLTNRDGFRLWSIAQGWERAWGNAPFLVPQWGRVYDRVPATIVAKMRVFLP